MEKEATRRAIRRAVRGMTAQEREQESLAVCDRFMGLPEVAAAKRVMVFISMSDEIDTAPVVRACLDAGKQVYAPKTTRRPRRMEPARVESVESLRPGTFGILEPPRGESCAPGDLDVILVPAVGFDRQGNRLGRGAGYYDRFMCSPGFRAFRVGVGFRPQLVDQVPVEGHDLPVHVVVTAGETARVRM